jgi:mannosyltransferase
MSAIAARGRVLARGIATDRAQVLMLGGIVLLAGLLRFWDLGSQSYWYDEVDTLIVAKAPLGDAWHHIAKIEFTPPLYFALGWAWGHVLGYDEFRFRALSAIAGTATVPFAWAAVREIASNRAALLTAAFVATNPLLVWFSQEARSYSLMVMLSTAALWLCLRARRTGASRDLWWWAVAAALSACAHYYAAFVVVAQAVLLLVWLPERRRQVLRAWGVVVGVGIALAPLAIVQLRADVPGNLPKNWITDISVGNRVSETLREIVYGNTDLISSNSPPPHSDFRWLVVAGLVVAVVGLLSSAGTRRVAKPLLIVALAGFLIPLALTVTPADTFKDRNLIAAWVPLLAAVGVGLSARRLGVLGIVAAAGIAVAGVAVQRDVLTNLALQRLDWRSLGATLERPARPRAVVMVPSWNAIALGYFGHTFTDWRPGTRVTELILAGQLGSLGTAPPPPPRGFRQVEKRQVYQLWFVRYRSEHPVALSLRDFRIHAPEPQIYLER